MDDQPRTHHPQERLKENDPVLLRALLSGEDQGVRWLIDQFQDVVFGLCLRMLRHRHDAEDATQETFLRAVRGIGSFDTSRPLRPWILGIAANRCRSALSKRARHPAPIELLHDPADRRPIMTEADDLADELEKALEHLRPDYRLVFLLFHEHGMSYDDISDNLGRPIGTIKTWLHRAREELSQHLSRRGVRCPR